MAKRSKQKVDKRPKKNIVLFLVEGDSERNAFSLAIPELYDRIDSSYQVYFPKIVAEVPEDSDEYEEYERVEVGGDITQRYDVWPKNYDAKVFELFLHDFFDAEKLQSGDITEIIQLVDMDGAYINDEAVVQGSNPNNEDKPFYADNSMPCLC